MPPLGALVMLTYCCICEEWAGVTQLTVMVSGVTG